MILILILEITVRGGGERDMMFLGVLTLGGRLFFGRLSMRQVFRIGRALGLAGLASREGGVGGVSWLGLASCEGGVGGRGAWVDMAWLDFM